MSGPSIVAHTQLHRSDVDKDQAHLLRKKAKKAKKAKKRKAKKAKKAKKVKKVKKIDCGESDVVTVSVIPPEEDRSRLPPEDSKNIENRDSRICTSEHEWGEKGEKFKSGRWSTNEHKILIEEIDSFVKEHNIELTALLSVGKSKLKRAWLDIARCLPNRTIDSCYYHGERYIHNSGVRQKWTEDEINDLERYVQIHGRKWVKIGKLLGRYNVACRDKYRDLKSQGTKRQKWFSNHDERLVKYVRKFHSDDGVNNSLRKYPIKNVHWDKVVQHLHDRGRNQARHRYYNVVLPRLVAQNTKNTQNTQNTQNSKKSTSYNGWTDKQELALINAIVESGAEDESEIPWENLHHVLENSPEDHSLIKPRFTQCAARNLKLMWKKIQRRIPSAGLLSFNEIIETLVADIKCTGSKESAKKHSEKDEDLKLLLHLSSIEERKAIKRKKKAAKKAKRKRRKIEGHLKI